MGLPPYSDLSGCGPSYIRNGLQLQGSLLTRLRQFASNSRWETFFLVAKWQNQGQSRRNIISS